VTAATTGCFGTSRRSQTGEVVHPEPEYPDRTGLDRLATVDAGMLPPRRGVVYASVGF
jgi:hypothetical protein